MNYIRRRVDTVEGASIVLSSGAVRRHLLVLSPRNYNDLSSTVAVLDEHHVRTLISELRHWLECRAQHDAEMAAQAKLEEA